jgi:hypothetical protein
MLGKLPPKLDARTLRLAKYLTPALQPPPNAINYATPVKSWPMMGNDVYGDCTTAAAGHLIEAWTANAGKEVTPTLAEVLAAYNHFAHGVADAGATILEVLKYWRSTGIGTDKISAFVAIDLSDQPQAQSAVYLFGGCYLGLALPNFAVQPGTNFLTTPWVVPSGGATGNAAPNPMNGHCVPAIGYDNQNLWIVTWGALKSMSWEFYNAYVDEAYALLSADWINPATEVSPPGLDLAALQADLADL